MRPRARALDTCRQGPDGEDDTAAFLLTRKAIEAALGGDTQLDSKLEGF